MIDFTYFLHGKLGAKPNVHQDNGLRRSIANCKAAAALNRKRIRRSTNKKGGTVWLNIKQLGIATLWKISYLS